MSLKNTIRGATAFAGLAVMAQAEATTGLSSLAGLAELFFALISLGAYFLVFLLLIVFIRKRKIRVMLVVAFFAGLLFVPPFQFIQFVGIHYLQQVDNLPPQDDLETVEILGDHILRRKNGELVLFPERFGGNYNYWKILRQNPPVSISSTDGDERQIKIYNRKRAYEFRDIEKGKFGDNLITIPLIAYEVPRYRILDLSGRQLPNDWQADGEILHGAAGADSSPDWVRELITQGAELDYRDPVYRQTPLHRAIQNGQFEIATVLLDAGAAIDVADNKGRKPIDLLMTRYLHPRGIGDTPEIRALLKSMESGWRADGRMLIIAANSNSDPAWIAYLIERGAPVDYHDPDHRNTALHLTVLRRQFDSAKALIRLGAQKNLVNKEGHTPGDYLRQMLDKPAVNDDPVKLNALLELVEPHWKATGLMLHMRQDNPLRIRALLQHGADPEVRNGNGDTALQHAIQMKQYGNAKTLILADVDLSGINGAGMNLVQSLTLFVDRAETAEVRRQREELLELIRQRQ